MDLRELRLGGRKNVMTRMPSYQQAQIRRKIQEVVPTALLPGGEWDVPGRLHPPLPSSPFSKNCQKKLPKIGEYQIMDDHHHQTFWCHECDMSVSLLPLPTSFSRERERERQRDTLLCPHCFSDLLELMDSDSLQHDSLILQPPPHQPHPHSDNYLLNSPFLHRLIHHLSTHPINHDDLLPSATASSSSVPSSSLPASKASVDSIPTLKITSSMLDRDPLLLCAVCKEQFHHSVDAKQLPCNHLYHPHCILPWLSSHSSCPLCRFQLPTETQHHQLQLGHHTPLRFNFDNDDDEDLNDWFTEYGSSSSYGTSLRLNYISAGGRHMANQAHLGPAAAPNFNANADSSFNGNL